VLVTALLAFPFLRRRQDQATRLPSRPA